MNYKTGIWRILRTGLTVPFQVLELTLPKLLEKVQFSIPSAATENWCWKQGTRWGWLKQLKDLLRSIENLLHTECVTFKLCLVRQTQIKWWSVLRPKGWGGKQTWDTLVLDKPSTFKHKLTPLCKKRSNTHMQTSKKPRRNFVSF